METSDETTTVTEADSVSGAAGMAAPKTLLAINNEQSDNTFISKTISLVVDSNRYGSNVAIAGKSSMGRDFGRRRSTEIRRVFGLRQCRNRVSIAPRGETGGMNVKGAQIAFYLPSVV